MGPGKNNLSSHLITEHRFSNFSCKLFNSVMHFSKTKLIC